MLGNVIWAPPVVIPEPDIERRLQKSRLINGFQPSRHLARDRA